MDDIDAFGRNDDQRRRFLNLCVGTIAVTFLPSETKAADLPHVAPDDPTASALGYVEDAAKLDAQKTPQYKPGQTCATCQQFTRQAGSDYGPCLIFSGKAVSGRGWCAAFVAKA